MKNIGQSGFIWKNLERVTWGSPLSTGPCIGPGHSFQAPLILCLKNYLTPAPSGLCAVHVHQSASRTAQPFLSGESKQDASSLSLPDKPVLTLPGMGQELGICD